MKISNVASIVNTKIDASILTTHTYISTECMLPNCGGIENCSSIPNGKVTGFDKNDILLSNIRPYFKKLWFSTRSGGCSNDVICLRVANRECLPKYLYYALCTDKFIDSFSASSKGTKMPRGDKNALLTYEIPDRNMEDQLHIVDILGSIDEKIENDNKQIVKLNQFLCLLFNKYSKKCNHRQTLEQVCKLITKGTTPTTLKKSFVDKGIDFIKVECLNDNHLIEVDKVAFIDAETHDLLNRSKLQYKDFLISIAGTIGRFALLPRTIQQANTNQAVAILRTKVLPQEYLYAVFNSGHCDEQIKAKTVQAVQANLSLSVIGSIEIPIIEDIEFLDVLKKMCSKIETIYENSLKLQKLKMLYLKKFFG